MSEYREGETTKGATMEMSDVKKMSTLVKTTPLSCGYMMTYFLAGVGYWFEITKNEANCERKIIIMLDEPAPGDERVQIDEDDLAPGEAPVFEEPPSTS